MLKIMPDYHPRGISMHLGTASLADSVTPNIIIRRGEEATKQSHEAEEVLQASKRLREELVLFPGDEKGFHLNWLGNTPFMQVQVIRDSQTSDDWVNNVKPCKPVEQIDKYSTKALVLHVDLSSKSFDSGLNAINNVQLKIEVLFNGCLSNSASTSSKERPSDSKYHSRLFAGVRTGFQAEKPWLITPFGCESNETTKNFWPKNSAEMRYAEICRCLTWEADQRSIDRDGNIPPSAEFLSDLANMQLPEQVRSMQDPDGRSFGIIDVVITAGTGVKLNSGVTYLTAPQRLGDETYNDRLMRDYGPPQPMSSEALKKDFQSIVPDAAGDDVDVKATDDSGSGRSVTRQAPALRVQMPISSEFQPISHTQRIQSSLSENTMRSNSEQNPTNTALSTQYTPTNSSPALQFQRCSTQVPAIEYESTILDTTNQHPHKFSNTVLPPFPTPFPSSMSPSLSSTTCGSSPHESQILTASSYNSSGITLQSLCAQLSVPSQPILNASHDGSIYHHPSPYSAIESRVDPHLLASSPSWPPKLHLESVQTPMNPFPRVDHLRAYGHIQGLQMPTFSPNFIGPKLPPYPMNLVPSSMSRTYPQVLVNPRASTELAPSILPPTGLYTVPTKPKAKKSSSVTVAAIDNNRPRSSFLLKRLIITGKNGTKVVDHAWSVVQRIALKKAPRRIVVKRRRASIVRSDTPNLDAYAELQELGSRHSGVKLDELTSSTSTTAQATVKMATEECDTILQSPHAPRYIQGQAANKPNATHRNSALPLSVPNASTEAAAFVIQDPSALAPGASQPMSQRCAYSGSSVRGIQGPKAGPSVCESTEEALPEAHLSLAARSPGKRGLVQTNEAIQTSIVSPAAKAQGTESSPLSSPPGSPMQDVRSELSDTPMSDKDSPQLDGPSEERADVTRTPLISGSIQPSRIPNLLPPSTPKAASTSPMRNIPEGIGKRKRAHTSTINSVTLDPPFSAKQDTPLSSSAPPRRSLNENCVISFAEGDKKDRGGKLRQIRAERSGFFKEEYVVTAARFYVPGWFGQERKA